MSYKSHLLHALQVRNTSAVMRRSEDSVQRSDKDGVHCILFLFLSSPAKSSSSLSAVSAGFSKLCTLLAMLLLLVGGAESISRDCWNLLPPPKGFGLFHWLSILMVLAVVSLLVSGGVV